MAEEITKQEFEKNLFQLSVHGVNKDEIEKLRNKFNTQITVNDNSNNIIKNEAIILQRLGGRFKRKNRAKVIR